MKTRDAIDHMSPRVLAVAMAITAIGLLAFGGAFFYLLVHPLAVASPPPVACWIAGSAFSLLGLMSAFLSVSYAGKSRLEKAGDDLMRAAAGETYAAGSHAGAAATSQAAPPATNPIEKSLEASQDALLGQPALQQSMGPLVEALVAAAPEHCTAIHLCVEARTVDGKTSILFTLGDPAAPQEYTTLVSDAISDGAFRVCNLMLHEEAGMPGFEVVLNRVGETDWDLNIRRLDEPGPPWSSLPRCPIRVCGYGLSLAPLPGTVFRWAVHANPPTVIAACRAQDAEPFRRVQLTPSPRAPRVLLGEGVTASEEVIEISEGPAAARWTIETPAFHALWPAGLDLRYPLASKTRFDLVGADNTLVFVQEPGPGIRSLDDLAGEGQTMADRGRTAGGHGWIEFAYEVSGAEWRQRHYAGGFDPAKPLVVSAQAPLGAAEGLFRSAAAFADSLQPPSY